MLQRTIDFKAQELLYITDFNELADVGERMQKECEPHIPYDREGLIGHMHALVTDLKRETFNCWIAKHKGRIIGFSIAFIQPMFFSKVTLATLSHWYVLPTYRNSRTAFELLHTFEQWARMNGAFRIDLGASKSVGDPDAINRIFTKRGFTGYGQAYYKDLI